MNNELIRNALKRAGMKQWELADLLGIDETTLSKKFRYELPAEDQRAIVKRIEAANEHKEAN